MNRRGAYTPDELDSAYGMVTAGGLTMADAARRLNRSPKCLAEKLRVLRGFRPPRRGDFIGRPVILPTMPARRATAALCGSPEKVDALAERYAAGESLYHKDDEKRLAPLPQRGSGGAENPNENGEDDE